MLLQRVAATAVAAILLAYSSPPSALAQMKDTTTGHQMPREMDHGMFRRAFGDWQLAGMAQVFPVVTGGALNDSENGPLRRTEWYLTQPALMANLESPSGRLVLRTTFNFEGLTLDGGELTLGGWGEGFIDRRHPHTLLHEFMLSLNLWEVRGTEVSLSAGKGFAPYGTDDPMARPGLKYPTNHHLSQVLERWTVNGIVRRGPWSLEAGVFGGTEPDGPYDMSNIGSFADSWSGRLTRRWGSAVGGGAEWEASASYASITEARHEEGLGATHQEEGIAEPDSPRRVGTGLMNAALRHSGPVGPGKLYALAEASRSDPGTATGYFSLLGEMRYEVSRHEPYLRLEYATRPEYARSGSPGTDAFFRYDHDADPIGATRWLIATAAYAVQASADPVSFRPFVEAQYNRVRAERGDVPRDEFPGTGSYWVLSLGVRLFLGGGPMRMGSYGILDPMTNMGRRMVMPGNGMS